MYLHDLEELKNYIDEIIPEEYCIFTEEYILELIDTILHLMHNYIEENPCAISEPDFNDTIKEEITDMVSLQLEDFFLFNEELEEDIEEIIDYAIEIFFITIYNGRSLNNNSDIYNDKNDTLTTNNVNEIDGITIKINNIRSKPQPDQRTDAWYIFRHNLITASNAYKAFESQSTVNQLIYEKCQPLKNAEQDKQSTINTNTTLHWGQKYEPLSIIVYEEMFSTKIEDFGCIKHDNYSFLGASPDGINVDKKNKLYGRMLEIKNIVNREITGIPKKEYWIQTQLQMEVCDLDECDFLETKFTEYETSLDFYCDTPYCKDNDMHYLNNIDNKDNCSFTLNNQRKGIIIYFNTKEAKPFYVYKPLSIQGYENILQWEEDIIQEYQSDKFNMTFIKIIYWKLEKLSCVLILRNKKWFQDNIGEIEKVWKIIEKERITGFSHRAPQKRMKKDNGDSSSFINQDKIQGCFLNLDKIDKKLDNSDTKTLIQPNIQSFFQGPTKVIKIRTESIDETKEKSSL